MTTLDFVIAGAQKGGSTQLASMVSSLEEVWLPKREDPAFETPFYETGSVDRLRYQLATQAAEATCAGIKRPSYLGIACIPERIALEFPSTRIILVVRDPVDRAVSAYLHQAQYAQVSLLPVSDALTRLLDGDDLGSPRSYEILHWGRYGLLLPRWQALFGSRLLVAGNGDLRTQPGRVLTDVAAHLGVTSRRPTGPGAHPETSNVSAISVPEMRLRRGMHRAINSVDPMTRQLLPRSRNPIRLTVGGVFREAAHTVHKVTRQRSEAFVLTPEAKERLRDYYDGDYRFMAEHFAVRL